MNEITSKDIESLLKEVMEEMGLNPSSDMDELTDI